MKKNGFTLIEILIAIAIALVMLTTLLTLQARSTRLASETALGIDSLPVAIEHIEELTKQDMIIHSETESGRFTVITDRKEVITGVNLVQIQVEVFYNEKPCVDLSLYRFRQ